MALFQQKPSHPHQPSLPTTAPQLSLIDTRGNSSNLLFQCHSSHTQFQGPYLIPNQGLYNPSQQMAAAQQPQSNIVYHHYYHHLHHHHYLNSNSSINGPNSSGPIVCCPNNNNNNNSTGPSVPTYLHPYRHNNRNTIDSNPIIVLQPPPPPPSIPLPQPQSIVCTAAAGGAASATAIPPRIFYNNPSDLHQYQYKSNGWIPGTGSSTSSLNSHHRKYPAQSITVQSPILISAIQDTAQNSSVSASSSPSSSSSSSSSSSLYPNSSSPSSGTTTNSISPSTGFDPDTATSEEICSSSSSSELSSSSSSPPQKHTEDEDEEEPETNGDSETPTETPKESSKETPTVKSTSSLPFVTTAEVPTVLATKSAASVPLAQIHLSSSSSSSSPLPPQPQNVQYPVQFTMPGYHSYAQVAPSMQLIQSQPLAAPPPPPPTVQQFLTLPAPPPPASGTALRDYYAQFGVYYRLTSWNQSYGMERVWMSEFRRIFSNFYCELWSIQPVERKPGGIRLNMFVDSAKVRFCCEKCGHSWTSMKGRIVFWFGLLSPNFNIGLVAIKLFGQKCEVCAVEMFQQPMWYPEEVTKVLMNLFNRVGQIYYGFEKTKFEKQRRIGKPRTPHNQYLCQACTEGICLSRRRQLSEQSGQPEPLTARADQKKEESHEDQPESQPEEKNEKKDLETDPQSEITTQQQEPQDHRDQKECSKNGSNKGIQELVIKKKINFSEEDDEDSEDSGIVSLV